MVASRPRTTEPRRAGLRVRAVRVKWSLQSGRHFEAAKDNVVLAYSGRLCLLPACVSSFCRLPW